MRTLRTGDLNPPTTGDRLMDDALVRATEQVGDRWRLQVVAALLDGPLRFTDLAARLEGIAPNTLSARLSDLERDGLVVSIPYQQRPERFSYDLTDEGRDLRDVVAALRGWHGRRRSGAAPRHEACGSELDVRWYCPSCRRAVSDPGEDLTWV